MHHALKFGDYNVGREGPVLTLPAYMAMFLEFEDDEDIVFPAIDVDAVNQMAEGLKTNVL